MKGTIDQSSGETNVWEEGVSFLNARLRWGDETFFQRERERERTEKGEREWKNWGRRESMKCIERKGWMNVSS